MRPFLKEDYFRTLSQNAFSGLKDKEHLFANVASESTQFIRINNGKIRQIGTVEDAGLELTFILEDSKGLKKSVRAFTLTGELAQDQDVIKSMITAMRMEAHQLPVDPYAQLPKNPGSSSSDSRASLLDQKEAAEALLKSAGKMDIAGFYAAGTVARGIANSAGLSHWFSSDSFFYDYSVYTASQRALKGTYAGQSWDQKAFQKELERAESQISILEKPAIKIKRGGYRTFLGPAAVENLVAMFSWGTISEAAIQQGDSCLVKVRKGEKSFSPLFNLVEDFSAGEMPRFNAEGELAPLTLPLIADGKLLNSLVSSRTAQEYKVNSNGASGSESLRSPHVKPGSLKEEDVLKALGEGLYLSNLHYLNWSDQSGGRITGMTRYACFWVEDGKIVAPIENMRWDDSLFHFFGSELESLTSNTAYLPETGTYVRRTLGGSRVPGAMLKKMEFTL